MQQKERAKFSAFHKLVAGGGKRAERRTQDRVELPFIFEFSAAAAVGPSPIITAIIIIIFGPSCCCCCCGSWHRKRATSCRRASQTPESMPQRLVAISAKTRDEGKSASSVQKQKKKGEGVPPGGRLQGPVGLASSCCHCMLSQAFLPASLPPFPSFFLVFHQK